MGMEERTGNLYENIAAIVRENNLHWTEQALRLIRRQVRQELLTTGSSKLQAELMHGFQVTKLLADLQLPLSKEEQDVLLASALLHIYPEVFPRADLGALLRENGFPTEIIDLLEKTTPGGSVTEAEMRSFYSRVQENRLALLLCLADRGNVVQNLHRYSGWNAHRYIDETKACYYPMCIYGKEHYHELLSPISTLMDKMRTLTEAAEILLKRYESREAELMQDILALREENATIRGIIAKFRREEAAAAEETPSL